MSKGRNLLIPQPEIDILTDTMEECINRTSILKGKGNISGDSSTIAAALFSGIMNIWTVRSQAAMMPPHPPVTKETLKKANIIKVAFNKEEE